MPLSPMAGEEDGQEVAGTVDDTEDALSEAGTQDSGHGATPRLTGVMKSA